MGSAVWRPPARILLLADPRSSLAAPSTTPFQNTPSLSLQRYGRPTSCTPSRAAARETTLVPGLNLKAPQVFCVLTDSG
eukprot:6470798-Prymnesium_polylepis.1